MPQSSLRCDHGNKGSEPCGQGRRRQSTTTCWYRLVRQAVAWSHRKGQDSRLPSPRLTSTRGSQRPESRSVPLWQGFTRKRLCPMTLPRVPRSWSPLHGCRLRTDDLKFYELLKMCSGIAKVCFNLPLHLPPKSGSSTDHLVAELQQVGTDQRRCRPTIRKENYRLCKLLDLGYNLTSTM
jgi:hypothetical protein